MLYAVGFTTSSVFFFAIASVAGFVVASLWPAEGRLRFFGVACLSLAVVDLLRMLRGAYGSFGLMRQTPRSWGTASAGGVALWGLDTGLVVTTVRATCLPFLGVVGVISGFGAPWFGLFYALGYLAALIWSCARPRACQAPEAPIPRLLTMHRLRDRARLLGIVYSALAGVLLLVIALP